jgi:hypothetical protein
MLGISDITIDITKAHERQNVQALGGKNGGEADETSQRRIGSAEDRLAAIRSLVNDVGVSKSQILW